MRLYRVSAATGLPVSGNGPAIYEAYKPGTAPGQPPKLASRSPESPDDSAAEPGADAADSKGGSDATGMGAQADTGAAMPPATAQAPLAADGAPAADGSTAERNALTPGSPTGAGAVAPTRAAPGSGTGGLY